MKGTEKRKPSIRDDILGMLSEKRILTREEIIAKVREKRVVSPKSIEKQMSNLLKAGVIVSKGEREQKKYELPEGHPAKQKLTEKSMKEDLRVLSQSEIEALRSVVHGIAPLLIDAGEEVELYDLLGRVHDLDKLVASHDLSDGYLTIARLCTDFFRRYPSTFNLETDLLSTNPLRAKVSVTDPLGLLLVRHGFDDKEINQLQYFKDKQDYQTQIVIESVKKQNEIIEKIDEVLRDYPDLRYVARVFALKKASPRWIFGYEFEEDLRKINTVLQKSGLKFDVESEDRLVMRLIRKPTREEGGKQKEEKEDRQIGHLS